MQIYMVGGAVRDRLLGRPVNDRDWVVVGATPEQMVAQGFTPVGRDFPVFHPQQVAALAATLRARFAKVRCMGLYIPLYGAYWGMAVVSQELDAAALAPAQVRQRLAERGVGDLQYYNPEVHPALFALPNYYRTLLAPAAVQPMRRVA